MIEGSVFERTIGVIQNVSREFPDFKKTPLEKRKNLLEAFTFSLVHKKNEVLERLTSAQQAPTDVINLEYVESLDYLHFLKTKLSDTYEQRLPLGPCVIFGSWSSPLLRFCESVMTALVFGNTVLLHCDDGAAEIYKYLEGLLKGGEHPFPENSLALVTGNEDSAVELLYTHPALRAVYFAGHSYEGEFLNRFPRDPRKRYKANFGGHNPVIFLYHADLEALDELFLRSIQFHYLGEMRFNRWFVQEKIYPEFTERIRTLAEHLDPKLIGHSPHEAYTQKLQQQDKDLSREKNWWPLQNIKVSFDFNNCSPWQQQEVLGPVLTLTRFKNAAEAVKFVNTTFYANAAAVFGKDFAKSREVGDQLQMPLVTYNRIPERVWEKPLHSMYESGFGNDVTAIDFFTVPKVLTVY